MSLSSDQKYSLKENTALTLKLEGVLAERVNSNPLMEMFGLNETDQIGLDDVLASIKKAKENDKIKGIYIGCKNVFCSCF